MEEDIQKKFLAAYDRDKSKYIKSWLVAWDYQAKRKKRNVGYSAGLPSDFDTYRGPEELVNWMNWFTKDFPNYLPEHLITPLIEQSLETDKKIGPWPDGGKGWNEPRSFI